LKNKLYQNLELLESFAAETFRLVSRQVNGTSMSIEVDPYTMSLDANEKIESTNSKMIGHDPQLSQELKHIWFYKHPEELA
jgi:hypothetical protein